MAALGAGVTSGFTTSTAVRASIFGTSIGASVLVMGTANVGSSFAVSAGSGTGAGDVILSWLETI